MIKEKARKIQKPVQQVKKRKTQTERVFDYLIKAGKKGATNFEMMVNLKICDVRKRISDLNSLLYEFYIESEFEESLEGKPHKRYWAVPRGMTLAEYLYETKRTRKIATKRTGGGFR